MDIVSILIGLLIAGIVYWLITLLPLPEPFPTVIRVVVIVALIIWLLQVFTGRSSVV